MPAHEPPVVWQGGVHLDGTPLWCDATPRQRLCFVSHAGLAVRPVDSKLLATEATLAIAAASRRWGAAAAWRRDALASPCGRPFSLGRLRLELVPSGRMPGAAQLLVDTGERRVLYAGEVNACSDEREAPPWAEPCQVRGADVLVVAAPVASLGRPLPPRAVAEAELVAIVREALASGRLPIVLAPSPGVAERAALVLDGAGVPLRVHARVAACLRAYRALGLTAPAPSVWRRGVRDAAVVWPLELRDDRAIAGDGLLRIAASGMALAPDAAERLGVERAIALSDHADLDGLCAHVRATGASEVYVTVGNGPVVGEALARLGVAVHPLGPPTQMPLFV